MHLYPISISMHSLSHCIQLLSYTIFCSRLVRWSMQCTWNHYAYIKENEIVREERAKKINHTFLEWMRTLFSSLHFVSLSFDPHRLFRFASLLWLYSLKLYCTHIHVCVCLEPGFWCHFKQDSLLGITVTSLVLYPGYMKMASIISL